ncbi:MAG TPA: FMN-binding protein [Dongiaceae bacterium]|nr:FMN-binding protein [Dongiaceae bacterium]
MIKKIITAAFVALTFVIYSIHQRNEGSAAVSAVQKSTSAAAGTNSTNNSSTTSTSSTASSSPSTATTSSGQYKDGSYTGTEADAFYGYIQVKATISSGRLTDVTFLEYPNDRQNSVEINNYAMPQLKQQAIQVQSAQVDGVSGATDTSQAFIQSLGDALSQAKS